jgi:hypothetical protein
VVVISGHGMAPFIDASDVAAVARGSHGVLVVGGGRTKSGFLGYYFDKYKINIMR